MLFDVQRTSSTGIGARADEDSVLALLRVGRDRSEMRLQALVSLSVVACRVHRVCVLGRARDVVYLRVVPQHGPLSSAAPSPGLLEQFVSLSLLAMLKLE